jgi:hypothetical protein
MKTMLLLFALAASPASVFCGDRHIAFERDQAVWLASLDGTGQKKIADGIFPAISPDGTRVAFNTTEKTSDTRKPGVDLPARETCANAERERALKITSVRHCHVRHGGFVLWRIDQSAARKCKA